MTSTVKVTSHNHPTRIETFDSGIKTGEIVLRPSDGEVTLHTTTTRELRITDVDYGYGTEPAEASEPAAATEAA